MSNSNTPITIHTFIDYEISVIGGMSEEQKDVYKSYVLHLVQENNARTLIEQCALFAFAGATLEAARVQSQGLAASESMQLSAAENIFRKLDYSGEPPTPAINADIAAKAAKYITQYAFRKATCERLEEAGYGRAAVEVEAQRLSLGIAPQAARLADYAVRRQLAALRSFALAAKLSKGKVK